jgi:hypothetical protein
MEPPKTPSRNNLNPLIPMTPVKKIKQSTHYLELLMNQYEQAHKSRNPKFISGLLSETFAYLESFFFERNKC